ncbi:hypothetical protein AOC36_01690 [Erysipelothrix larvae]|uniref:DUF308 domain-containing protein n=2 Tax=Erysipelothrix larvae TaxID=1514105 RepID=A0A0X8GYT5_9FIRM|nr:hypothetical protein AOC36_01690 [Erysipelothrix larvae]
MKNNDGIQFYEKKSIKKFSFILQILFGLFVIVIGISIIMRENFWWWVVKLLIQALLVGTVFTFLFRSITNRNRLDLLISFGSLGFFIYSLFNENIFMEFFSLFFGVWALFNAAVRGLELFVSFQRKQKGKIVITLEFLAGFVMGTSLLVSGAESAFFVNLQVGIYLILHGILQIVDLFRVNLGSGYTLRMPAPIFATALLPSFLVKKIEREVALNPDLVLDTVEPTIGDYVSIYIYIKDYGYNRMGHIDIGYNGAIYSYGCHDPLNRHSTQAYGDGVLIVGSECEFVQYSVDDSSTVYRFLCKLTPQQRDRIEERIDLLMKPAYYYDYPLDHEKTKDSYLKHLKDSQVGVDYYKFISGPFKTYNVFTTNCVLVAEYIVQSTGMQLFHVNGIITPGTYYSYLHSNVGRVGSIVEKEYIYKKIGAKPKY